MLKCIKHYKYNVYVIAITRLTPLRALSLFLYRFVLSRLILLAGDSVEYNTYYNIFITAESNEGYQQIWSPRVSMIWRRGRAERTTFVTTLRCLCTYYNRCNLRLYSGLTRSVSKVRLYKLLRIYTVYTIYNKNYSSVSHPETNNDLPSADILTVVFIAIIAIIRSLKRSAAVLL